MCLKSRTLQLVPDYQGKGYAKSLIDFIVEKYREQYAILQVGTGDSPLTIPFYEKCGFVRSHIIPNFFTDNYDHQYMRMEYSWWIWCICKRQL